jgi:hypothetical protein
MRATIIILIVVASLLMGCKNEPTPEQVVGAFVEAVRSGHPDKTANLLNKYSQPMVKTSLVTGNGIAWIVDQSSSNYQLMLDKSSDEDAIVLFKIGQVDSSSFSEPEFPPQLRKDGVKFYLVRESGRWRIDLLKSEGDLSDIVFEHLVKLNKGVLPNVPPPWWPTPGVPPIPPLSGRGG